MAYDYIEELRDELISIIRDEAPYLIEFVKNLSPKVVREIGETIRMYQRFGGDLLAEILLRNYSYKPR